MIAWFIIGIATLAVFTFLALNATENIAAATELHSRTETVRRMEAAVSSLLAASRSPNANGLAFLPAGRVEGASYILPATLEHIAKTPFGQPIVYCPFGGLEAGTAVTVPSANTSSYNIQIASFEGVNYVVGGRPGFAQVSSNPNLLGWLVAARTRSDPIPSCNGVTFNTATNKFSAPGAIVRPIIRTIGPDESREITNRELVWYVSPTGSGNGFSATSPSSFITALDFWRSRQPPTMRIVMSAGNYSIVANYLNIDGFQNQFTNSTLALQGVGNVTINQAAESYIQLPGTLEITGINFSPTVGFFVTRGSNLTLTDVSAGSIWVTSGGKATTTNVNLSTGAHSNTGLGPVVVRDGTLTMRGNTALTTQSYGLYNEGGNLNIDAASISITSTGSNPFWHAVMNLAGSNMNVSNTLIRFNSQFFSSIFNVGDFAGLGMVLQMDGTINAAIFGWNGSTTVLTGGGISASSARIPSFGFADGGAARISGSGFELRASECWWRGSYAPNQTSINGLVSQSAAPAPGANISVLPDVVVPPLTGNSAGEIMAYNQAIRTNQMRAALRNLNTSSWPCV